jgi:chromosome transmission fidelity protein 18
MRARQWKSKLDQASNEMASNANTKAKAGETQLLQYLNKENRQSIQHISRYDKHLKLLPSEGHKNLPITLGDGTRVFVKVLKETKVSTTTNKHSCSLGISMVDLLRRVQAVQRKKEHDRMKDLSHELKNQRKKLVAKMDGEDTDTDASDDEAMDPIELMLEPRDDRLWVDKHAPATFANLLSDERTNREVLRALREWDPYVFKRDPPPRPQFYAQQQTGKENDDFKNNPKDKRPDERNRVILLSGSPGVGKTTLANIVARHCGYRPMEVNGSDERSAKALTERVVRAMETATLDMHAMGAKGNDWKGRPNCIILDEIDGADAKQALQALVELIRQEMPSKDAAGKQRNKAYLTRPIICICNNLYAPALRPLLPYARSFQVDPPAAPRLVARLRAVLSTERLSLWGGASLLHDLVACSGGDIRSCLYTLQFAAAKVHCQQKVSNASKDISRSLQSALKGDGMKDSRTDVAGTTMTVFRKIKDKGKDDRLWGTRQASDPRSSVERVLDAVEVSSSVALLTIWLGFPFCVTPDSVHPLLSYEHPLELWGAFQDLGLPLFERLERVVH